MGTFHPDSFGDEREDGGGVRGRAHLARPGRAVRAYLHWQPTRGEDSDRAFVLATGVGVLKAEYLFGFIVIGKIESWRQKYLSQLQSDWRKGLT